MSFTVRASLRFESWSCTVGDLPLPEALDQMDIWFAGFTGRLSAEESAGLVESFENFRADYTGRGTWEADTEEMRFLFAPSDHALLTGL